MISIDGARPGCHRSGQNSIGDGFPCRFLCFSYYLDTDEEWDHHRSWWLWWAWRCLPLVAAVGLALSALGGYGGPGILCPWWLCWACHSLSLFLWWAWLSLPLVTMVGLALSALVRLSASQEHPHQTRTPSSKIQPLPNPNGKSPNLMKDNSSSNEKPLATEGGCNSARQKKLLEPLQIQTAHLEPVRHAHRVLIVIIFKALTTRTI